MDAIFREIRPAELFSSRNGLMICLAIEKYFDAGVMTIVPDLPEKPTDKILHGWFNREVRDFKVCIIVSEWAGLERPVYTPGSVKWKGLDNRRLHLIHDSRIEETRTQRIYEMVKFIVHIFLCQLKPKLPSDPTSPKSLV